jgi:outer membrane receptor for ferrienterochelin and colicins
MFMLRAQDEKFYLDGSGPSYQIYKLATTHKLAPMGIVRLTATAGIDNIFDYVDDTPYSGNRGTINPGRTFYAGLIIQLAD